jgi:hypothetical protein
MGNHANTVWVILAFTELFRSDPPENANVSAFFNSQEILRDEFGVLGEPISAFSPLSEIQSNTINEVDINKTGSAISYDLVVDYYLPVEKTEEINHGFGVIREYCSPEDEERQNPLLSAKKGDILVGRATLLVPEARYFVGVTIPLAAGMEAINFRFETEDQGLQNISIDANTGGVPRINSGGLRTKSIGMIMFFVFRLSARRTVRV